MLEISPLLFTLVWLKQFLEPKGTFMEIEKAPINDPLPVFQKYPENFAFH